MKKFVFGFRLAILVLLAQFAIQAQITTGSISGTVSDATGAVVPGATVSVRGDGGQQFTATTNSGGTFTIPAVGSGFYRVTVTAANFKTYIIENVKVDVATPSTVNATLEAGAISEQVVVTSGAEVLQTETATVGTNIQGRQILETPIQSRDALDLVTLLPGTATVGTVRTSSINGLPKSAITIQIDGVDVQDNYLKSSDGFFTFIRPRIDAIDEVTVSTASPGAESSGDGAVGIRFATRRGTDAYKGSLFWQHRDEGLNATNFQSNYLGQARQKLRLNQFGGSIGGPIPFLGLGETDDWYDSGKGKRYFFINYERFHLNEQSPVRTRQVITQQAQSGIFRYGTNGANSVDLFQLAQSAGLANTIDPTVNSVLNSIRAATGTAGAFQPVGTGNLWYRQPYNFSNSGEQRRRFLVVRIDANITKDHAFEAVFNDQPFRSNVDFLNSVDPTFPGVANAGTQQSDRRSFSTGLRSNFGGNLVNQFRYAQLGGWLGGDSRFDLVGGKEFWDDTQRGFSLGFGAGLTGLTIRNAYSARTSPTRDFTDNVTWIKGNHTVSFGGQLKRVETISDSVSPVVPTVGFGNLGAVLDPALNTAISVTTMPGASGTEVANAQALYATLVGRISSFGSTAYLEGDGQYRANGTRHFEIEENTNGLFVQDSWRILPNLTISGGVRWQPQVGAKLNTTNYAVLVDPDMIWDVSGVGNVLSPGTMTGTTPLLRANTLGEKAYRDDLDNFAPSVGVVWSPDFGEGFLGKTFGRNGTSVIRAGFSRAFIREGTLTVENSIGLNPGGTFSLARTANASPLAANYLQPGTLFRTPGNANLTIPAFNATPSYPRGVDINTDSVLGFSPDFRSGYVDSWSVGYQRSFGRDTVVEVRYVGNRGRDMQMQATLGEVNAIENKFADEFKLAQQNLLANIQCANTVGCTGGGVHFRYRGAGTGTNQLPIILSYFSGNNVNPALSASYSSSLFANATFIGNLNPANPAVQSMASTLDFNFRANTLTAGTFQAAKPMNFVQNCPATGGFCFMFENTEKSWYDSAVVEVRRRLSSGVRFQASYVYGKAFTNGFASAGTRLFGLGAGDQSNAGNVTLRNPGLDKSLYQVDIRHAFKFDATWDLPFGRGQALLNSSNWASNAIFGGWSLVPTVRWQSGSPVLMENIQVVGMSGEDLQKSVGVYYNQVINGVTVPVSYLPADIIENTIKAFTTATLTTGNATGYPVGGAPTGRFIAPTGYGNCQYRSISEVCGYRKFVLYGPDFFKMDASLMKKVRIDEKRNVELRVTVFDVLNRTNWRLGGWTGNVNNITAFTGTFGQMASGWSYQDPSGSNDPGGRLVDLMVRFNF